MEIARVPFKRICKTDLGMIFRPFIEVQLYVSKRKEWIPVEMLVDSGADYTMLPRRYAGILGIDLNTDCSAKITAGIGGSETMYMYKSLGIEINEWRKKIPVGFLSRDDVPPLLGRLKCLEVLEVVMRNRETIIKI